MNHATTQPTEPTAWVDLTEQRDLYELDPPPLVIEVGPTRERLRMSRLVFRQVLRAVAEGHGKGLALAEEIASPTRVNILTLCLLYALYLPIDGQRQTQAIRAALSGSRRDVFKSHTIWGDLEALRCPHPGGSRLEEARSRRLRAASFLCPMSLLEAGIADFERRVAGLSDSGDLAVHASRTAQTPIPAAAKRPTAAPQYKSLIRPPIPWRDTDPPLQLARNGSGAFFGLETIHPTRLGNVMALGGTGSGKTTTAVIPVLDSLLRYRLANGKRAAVLVIDPKKELTARVRVTLAELGEEDRLTVIGEGDPVGFFTPDCPLSPSDKLAKLETFEPGRDGDYQNAYWRNLGQALLRDLLQIEADYALAVGGNRLFAMLASELGLTSDESTNPWSALREVLTCARSSSKKLKEVDELLRRHCEMAGIASSSCRALQVYTGDSELIQQFNYVCMSAADTLGTALANPDLNRLVDFDILPDASKPRTDLAALMEAGQVVLFSPEMRQGHRIAAMALKAKWYEAVFSRKDLERPVGVVIDEAQRFLTNDPETGEQGFLDRCRAYRVITLLATQSLSSLKYEFGSGASAQTALDIISANTPSKFVFRSTDAETVEWLHTLIPPPDAGGPHIVDVRRPSGLRPGEAFYLLADGRWGRGRADLAGLL